MSPYHIFAVEVGLIALMVFLCFLAIDWAADRTWRK